MLNILSIYELYKPELYICSHISSLMEPLYQGRASINEDNNELQIIIPSKKRIGRLFLNTFLVFLVFSVAGFIFITLGPLDKKGYDNIFYLMYVILAFLCIMVVSVWIPTCLWIIFGKEIIRANSSVLAIEWKGSIMPYKKEFDAKEIRNLRIKENHLSNTSPVERYNFGFGTQYIYDLPGKSRGIIFFDYGLKSVSLGMGLDEAEAKYLVSRLSKYLGR